MKPLGIKLAAGAVTILFGAYAAAIAQRDKQDSSESWSAKTPSLGEPATPIADISEESWLSQPSQDATASAASPVQLVQHTEPAAGEPAAASAPAFDVSALPSSLGGEQASEVSQGGQAGQVASAPDWTLPVVGEAAQDPAAPQGSSPELSQSPEPSQSPGLTMSLPAESPVTGGADSIQTQAAPSEPANQFPELAVGEAPAVGVLPSGQAAATTDPNQPNLEIPSGLPSPATSGQPDNILRSADPAMNVLRGQGSHVPAENPAAYSGASPIAESPPFAAGPNELGGSAGSLQLQQDTLQSNPAVMAQSAPGFGQSARQFDQPAEMPNSSGAGLGAPQFAGGSGFENSAPPAGNPSPQFANPAPRLGNSAPQFGNSAPQFDNTAPQFGNSTPQFDNSAPQFGGVGQDRMASLPQAGTYPTANGFQPTPAGQPQAFQQAGSASAIESNATIASPGDRRLEGAQSPSVLIQKRAPSEVKVGKPASFVIHVQNVGTVEALDVQVHDRVPAGMRLIDASPAPVQQGNQLLWQLGAMPAGDERTVTMQLIPEQEGELGSVARVSFEAAASVRTISTRPELKIVQRVPEHGVLIGQQVEIELEVSNPGTGDATGVVLQEDVPEGLEHPKGRQLDNAIGTLAAGETRRQVLRMRAVAPGVIQNTIRLSGDDGLVDEHTAVIHVISPDLKVELEGPSKRFLERQATYQLNLANVGTADATNVEIVVQLDRGFTFVSTSNEGQYDPSQHVVHWSLAQLPAGSRGSVPLTLLPVEEGEQAITIDARADLGIIAQNERRLMVEGFAELSFAITNPGGPIEVGSETTYEVRVNNTGSKSDSNVRVQLQLPPGLELISTDGDAGTDGRGLVAFQPKAELPQGSELAYRIRVRGVAQGTHLVRAVVVSDQSTVPVTKEESTVVYADQ